MLLSSYIAGYSCLALASAAAVAPSVARRGPNAKKGLKMDFDILVGNSIHDASPDNKPSLAKRADGSVNYEITNAANYYQVSVQMGSNKDVCKVLLDTGSSYLWVMEQDVHCEGRPDVTGQLLGASGHKKATTRGTYVATDAIYDPTGVEPIYDPTGVEPIYDPTGVEPIYDPTGVEPIYETSGAVPIYDPTAVISGESEPTGDYGGGGIEGGTCTLQGSFNTDGSDTFHTIREAPAFSISYVDQSQAVGLWGNDTVGFADSSVQLSFGLVDQTSSNVGILGIGPYLPTDPLNSTSNNFPIQLKEQGIIDKVAYSLYLNQNSSKTGSVLFGAVDHKKYSGQLQTVPLVSLIEKRDIITSFAVVLHGVYLQGNKQNVTVLDQPIPAILDSGTTYSALPQELLLSLAASFSAQEVAQGMYEVDCAYSKNSGDIVFDFSGVLINVPVEQYLLQTEGKCFLAAQPLGETEGVYPYALLGDNVLRSAYVVYDVEGGEISLAQASYTDDEDVEVISSTVPSAVKAPQYSSTDLTTSLSEETSAKFKSLASQSRSSAKILALVLGMVCVGAML